MQPHKIAIDIRYAWCSSFRARAQVAIHTYPYPSALALGAQATHGSARHEEPAGSSPKQDCLSMGCAPPARAAEVWTATYPEKPHRKTCVQEGFKILIVYTASIASPVLHQAFTPR